VRQGDRISHADGPDQRCAFDEGLYLNAGAARIPSHHQATLGLCRELGVEMEALVNHSLSARIHAEGVNDNRPIQMREAVYGLRGHMASLLAKGVQNGGVDVALSAEDAARFVDSLREWGGLEPDLTFRHAETLGFTVEPGAGPVRGQARDAMTLAALTHPAVWGFSSFADIIDMQATMLQPVGGMDRLPKALAARLGDAIRLNTEVTRLGRENGKAAVEWRDRSTGQTGRLLADHCICTLPFTVLKDVRTDFSAERRAAIAGADYYDATKVAYQSPRFWEHEDQIYGGLSFTDRDTFMTWYPSGGFGRPNGVLVAGYSFGGQATRLGTLGLPAQDRYARETVNRLHPGKAGQLSRMVSVHWNRMPWSHGVAGEVGAGYDLMNEPDGPYHFAGEHLARVGAWQQGAIVSGWRAAEQIAERRQAAAA
jgi:monoamine oxidase